MFLGRAIAFVAAASAAVAQVTHFVGSGGHATIDAAIAVASPGDVIAVQSGGYPTFTVDKALTIRAVPPGPVRIYSHAPPIRVMPPPGADVHLIGLWWNGAEIIAGNVTMEECQHQTFVPGQYRTRVVDATLHLIACSFVGGAPTSWSSNAATIEATNAEVTMVDSVVQGHGATYPYSPGVAIGLTNSRLRASHCSFFGGVMSYMLPWHNVAIAGDAASQVWISDSTVTTLAPTCPIAASGRVDRSVLTPPCPMLPSGGLLGVDRPSPLRRGNPFTLEFRTEPFAPVGVYVGFELTSLAIAVLEQTFLLQPATAFPAGVRFADAAGLATMSWPIPAGPQFLDRSLWLQGFAATSSLLQASPLVGGVVR
jgi:hypothetical protein